MENPPKFVTQIDIDEMVLETCAKYLPCLNAPYLAQREGKNFKINISVCEFLCSLPRNC